MSGLSLALVAATCVLAAPAALVQFVRGPSRVTLGLLAVGAASSTVLGAYHGTTGRGYVALGCALLLWTCVIASAATVSPRTPKEGK